MIDWSAAEVAFMQHALGLAALGLNTTDPNPRVGCALVRDGQMIGEGWHERAGGPHAEVRALQAAGAAAEGATAYVTLEPCAAHGRTPPCTEALIAARVARVVYAAEDPNPRMRHGAQQLRAAGITVHAGLLGTEARELNPGFFKRHESGLPWVRLKLAVSMDGRTALANGESRWITGTAARKDSQRYRARSSAVLTGIGTVLADNPALNVRLEGALRQPLRVVLDSQLRSPPGSRVFQREGPSLVLAVQDDEARRVALNAAGAEVELVAADSAGHVSIRSALQRLAERSINEVWVESGAVLSGAFLASGLVDELIVYYAPCLLGSSARGMADLPGLTALEARMNFRFHEYKMIGDDLRITARPCLPA
jgi:diaminohydroxyphosphoribosylaminopyrimidine deaminase / 5-amino-6-(5-phosphoribosylamino)uracil reductase